MGSVTDGFIKQMRGAGAAMAAVQPHAVSEASDAVRPVMENAVRSMVGGDMVMRNVKPSGRITVTTSTRQTDAAAAASEIGATGPIGLIESGAVGHSIGPRRSRRGRRSSVYGQGYSHPISRPVAHPGFRGKGRWGKARDTQARPVAKEAYVTRNVTTFRKAFQ